MEIRKSYQTTTWKNLIKRFLSAHAQANYEKIICRCLVATLHEKGLFDQDQFAYIQDRDLCMALISYTHDNHASFEEGKHTGSLMIDFEGAFDAVWRNGVIYIYTKSSNWVCSAECYPTYIHDFLQNRFTRSLVNSVTTAWISTNVGIPQGSILGPIQYSIFTADIHEYIDLRIIKFADDITMWYSGEIFLIQKIFYLKI